MSIHRRAAKRDANEPEIVAALESLGFAVTRLSGEGVPDLLLSRAGDWYVAEVKMPNGRLKPAQIAFSQKHTGPVPIFRTRADVAAWEWD